MLKLKLRIINKKMVYRISNYARIPFAVFSFFLLWEMIINNSGLAFFPILVLVIALAGTFYRESWTFDNEKQTVTSIWGFFIFVKKDIYKYDDIANLDISHFIKGKLNSDFRETVKPNKKGKKAMLVFSIAMKDTDKHDIEILPESRSAGKTEEVAQSISSFTGLGLKIDRPRDMGTKFNLRDISKSPFQP